MTVASVVLYVPERGSRRKAAIPAGDRPKALASQFVPENTCCSCCSVALVRLASWLSRWVMKTTGVAPTSTTVNAGIAVPLIGSLPLILKDRTFAVEVLAGEPLLIGGPP